ncbi:MAG: NAD(+) synthase [Candidatus Thermoplasmatota archaeon]|nr:NAD(+) synthase [Candidatus Thermoplasmatota archaeon]
MQNWMSLADEITAWINEYATSNGISTLVVGVSGGVDSAVTSTLAARTGLATIALNMPIHQEIGQFDLAKMHISWLEENFDNVEGRHVDLTTTFDTFSEQMGGQNLSSLVLANSRARLRMVTLYAIAGSANGIVVGTGNKVEDFGVGFFTKYGDGGVDIAPIADLKKTEVYSIGKELGIEEDIQKAPPTDGLWDDGRTDEDQMGATYEELEWAMEEKENPQSDQWTERQKSVMEIFLSLHGANSHKMKPIPVYYRRRDSQREEDSG